MIVQNTFILQFQNLNYVFTAKISIGGTETKGFSFSCFVYFIFRHNVVRCLNHLINGDFYSKKGVSNIS